MSEDTEKVVIELNRGTTTAAYRAGDTLLQTARIAGLQAPYSCETGSCGTCMARIVEGDARMVNNDALEDDEVAEAVVSDAIAANAKVFGVLSSAEQDTLRELLGRVIEQGTGHKLYPDHIGPDVASS